ncbi:transcription regulator hth lysr [Lucifera butyrica]|uniref:Transcription regulator hth lysr n=1 Tax=Lucifera butyrica TaxID=1351585 RepID=A0A498R524_9FIRM|nr:LysR family transcriptional regulator [Lucifera butyrica]VBB05362.1 transcription regulator hth lysr [Lucifera butyrica]
MNISLLKAFRAITEEGSFSKAAERLFISQPALSQNIKWLENYYSVPLIKRNHHGLSLTEAGEILYKHALKLTEMSDRMEEDMKALRSSLDDSLSVGATSVIGGYAVPCSIFIFKRKRPHAIIKLKMGNRHQLLEQLQKDVIDIAIIEGARPDNNFCSNEIHIEEMVVVAPNNDQWNTNTNTELSLEDFLKFPLIMREEGSSTRWAVERTLTQAKISLRDLNVIMELNSVDSIKAVVEAGHGVSILPRVAVKKELYTKTLRALQVENLAFSQLVHIVYKRKNHRTIATEFIKLMKSTANGFC